MSTSVGKTAEQPSEPAATGSYVRAGIQQPRISIRNLDFFYGQNRALKGINLDLPDRRVTGMISPSGCGNARLHDVMSRMYEPYPGQRADREVTMDGQSILAPDIYVNALRSRIGIVFQKPPPFPVSGYDNIGFGVRLPERLSK